LGKEDALQDESLRPGVKVRVGSISFVIPEEDTLEDYPNQVSVVQQSPVIINGVRADQSAGRRDSTEEWI
jgi:hypothetical protein